MGKKKAVKQVEEYSLIKQGRSLHLVPSDKVPEGAEVLYSAKVGDAVWHTPTGKAVKPFEPQRKVA